MNEAEALLELIKTRYGDRLTPDELVEVRNSLQTILDSVVAMRKLKLENGDEPYQFFKPEGEPK